MQKSSKFKILILIFPFFSNHIFIEMVLSIRKTKILISFLGYGLIADMQIYLHHLYIHTHKQGNGRRN